MADKKKSGIHIKPENKGKFSIKELYIRVI